jgi:CBS domain-containing protein
MARPTKSRQAFKVADVMTSSPLTVDPNDTIAEAEEIMNEQNIRQLPVVRARELVGIITDRDIRSFLGGRGLDAAEERETAMSTKAAAVMTTKPASVTPEDDLSDAVELLIEGKMGGIPVVDEEERLVGIVTYIDALRCLLDLLVEES